MPTNITPRELTDSERLAVWRAYRAQRKWRGPREALAFTEDIYRRCAADGLIDGWGADVCTAWALQSRHARSFGLIAANLSDMLGERRTFGDAR